MLVPLWERILMGEAGGPHGVMGFRTAMGS